MHSFWVSHSIVEIYLNLFTHFLENRPGLFKPFVIMNAVAMKILLYVVCYLWITVSSRFHLGVKFMGHRVSECLPLHDNAILISK